MDARYAQYLRSGEEAGIRYALHAPRKPPQGLAGMHLSHQTGSSLEFKEHREYQPGDDLRRIDWSVYARSDKLTVKLHHKEVHPHLDIVVDGSRSMALAQSAKEHATLGLAALFATAAGNAGYSHHAWLAGEGCFSVPNGTARPTQWQDVDFGYDGNPQLSFAHHPPTWRPHGIRVLLSDLLWLGDPLALLGYFADRAARVVIIQVLSRRDVEPPERGHMRLIDSETGEVQEILVDAVTQKHYQDAMAHHQNNWHLAARQVGAVMLTVVAESLVEDWLLDELVAREVLQIQ